MSEIPTHKVVRVRPSTKGRGYEVVEHSNNKDRVVVRTYDDNSKELADSFADLITKRNLSI